MNKKIVIIPTFCESHLIKCQIPNIIDTIDPDYIVYNEGMFPNGTEGNKQLTKEWLDKFGFPYKSIITCNNTMEKVDIIKDEDCFLVDDLSKKHEVQPPYKVLYWDVIQRLNEEGIDYEIFRDNWDDILKRRIP